MRLNKKGGFEWSLETTGKAIFIAALLITLLVIIALLIGPAFSKLLARFDFW